MVEQTGDMYGASRLVMMNRTTLNGAMFEVDGVEDLVDFIFSPPSRVRANVRWEHRPSYQTDGNINGQFEIGPADNEFITLGAVQNTSRVKFVSTSTISGTNLDVDGFSTNVAPVKVYTAATQAISATTNTKVIFGNVEINPITAAWSAASNRYIAQSAGEFYVSASIRTTGTNRSNRMMVYKNGVFYQSLCDFNTTALNAPFLTGSTIISLVATDYLEIWIYSSSSTTIASSRDTNFHAYRIY
jgi:hypothetical protein